MFSYKIFQNYWFTRKYEQFNIFSSLILGLLDKDSEVSEEAQNALSQLDRERAACQNAIGRLNLPSIADCETCGGKCCDRQPDYYFTPIDFWLTKYGEGYTHSFSAASIMPAHYYCRARIKRPFHIFKANLKLLIKKIITKLLLIIPMKTHLQLLIKKNFRLNSSNNIRGKCFYLGENGCELPHSERPIKCLIYVCPNLKKSLDYNTRIAYIKAIQELYVISLKTLNILKSEANYPNYYGYFTLKLII